jgi:hypothetical protein
LQQNLDDMLTWAPPLMIGMERRWFTATSNSLTNSELSQRFVGSTRGQTGPNELVIAFEGTSLVVIASRWGDDTALGVTSADGESDLAEWEAIITRRKAGQVMSVVADEEGLGLLPNVLFSDFVSEVADGSLHVTLVTPVGE